MKTFGFFLLGIVVTYGIMAIFQDVGLMVLAGGALGILFSIAHSLNKLNAK